MKKKTKRYDWFTNHPQNRKTSPSHVEDFTIETMDGKKLKNGSVRVSKYHEVNKNGNSLECISVWRELRDYFEELKNNGTTSQ